jgi:hypothetical protein
MRDNILLSADRANADWLHRECMLPLAAARTVAGPIEPFR